jgi:hypothetical protein
MRANLSMIRRLIVLLLAATTLWGGVYLLSARKSAPGGRTPAGVIQAADASTSETGRVQRRMPRYIVCLLVAAVALGSAAYVGFDDRAHVAAGSQPLPESGLNGLGHEEVLTADSQPQHTTVKADGGWTGPDPDELLPSGRRMRSDAKPAIQTPTDGFEAIVCSKPWPCAEAIKVASCESGLDRRGRLDGNWARNGNNYGLFQINSVHADRWPTFYQDWMDPVRNTEWAFEIWLTSGWGPWECNPKFAPTLKTSDDDAATLTTDVPTDTPSADDSTTPTPTPASSPDDSSTPTPSESPLLLGSASPTPSPVSLPFPTQTSKP